MNIDGKINLFATKRNVTIDGKEVTKTDLSTTISTKAEDGSYINKKVNVRLVGKDFGEEKIAKLEENKCYAFDVYEGFLGVHAWKNSRGDDKRELEFIVTKGKLLSVKEVVRKEVEVDSNLPF